jgi:hypothetical protein
VPDLSPAERQKVVEAERRIRIVALGMILGLAIALVDLLTDSVLGDWRIDVVVLGGCAVGLWGLFMARHFLRKLLTDEAGRPPGPGMRFSTVAFLGLSLAVTAGFGYVLGGPKLAVVLPVAEVVFLGVLTAQGVRRRKQRGPSTRNSTR